MIARVAGLAVLVVVVGLAGPAAAERGGIAGRGKKVGPPLPGSYITPSEKLGKNPGVLHQFHKKFSKKIQRKSKDESLPPWIDRVEEATALDVERDLFAPPAPRAQSAHQAQDDRDSREYQDSQFDQKLALLLGLLVFWALVRVGRRGDRVDIVLAGRSSLRRPR